MIRRVSLFFTISAILLVAQTSRAPELQWVKTVSGSGSSSVTGAATDSQGNLYIAGNTTSLDFPTANAVQPQPGGSPIVRIDPTSGAVRKLYAPDLAGARSIAADPNSPLTLYAASAAGLMRSTDGGNTWKRLPGLPSGANLLSVTVDPTNSKVLYAATFPLGVFKTIDGGVSWTALNNGIPPTSSETVNQFGYGANTDSLYVNQIWVDPKSPNVLFASNGDLSLLRSTDAGASWTVSPSPATFVRSLVFDPFTEGTLYAAGLKSFVKSTDEGQTWTGLPVLNEPAAIALDPFHKGTLYAGTFNALFESTDGGQSWTQRITGWTSQITADPNKPVIYANPSGHGVIASTDGFRTYTSLGLQNAAPTQLLVAGSFLFERNAPTNDIFVTKLDNDGNIVYSTYFGGSEADSAAAIALGSDGSVYVTGNTNSTDFPTTKGTYKSSIPPVSQGASFVFKLNPNGSLAWSTYFSDWGTVPQAFAVDAAGNPHIGGQTSGGLPVTPGAYGTKFDPYSQCPMYSIGPCFPVSSAFLAEFNAQGSALIFSTYVSENQKTHALIQGANSMALAADGSVYFADGGLDSLNPSQGGVHWMNSTGTNLLQSNTGLAAALSSLQLDSQGNVFAVGSTTGPLATTPGVFQPTPQPDFPELPGSSGAGAGGNACIIKFDSALSKILAATLLGGEGSDRGQSLAIDSSGNVVVGGFTNSKAFPVRAPFQGSFSPASGFVAALDPALSNLLFSTFLGDTRGFAVQAAIPDGMGNVFVAGTVPRPSGPYYTGAANFVVVNKIAFTPSPNVRLDSVVNAASQLAVPLSPGEAIAALGSGFGSDAKLFLDGKPLPAISVSNNRIVSVVPNDAKPSGAARMTVSSHGVTSNSVAVPLAAASPGIFSSDGSGYGQGYILNADGTRNSQSNPSAPGKPITIFATGVGPINDVGGFAVTQQPVAVFVDGFYAHGIAAVLKHVPQLPGDVYEIKVYVPDPAKLVANNPDLKNFTFPPEVPVTLFIGGARSQDGLAIWIKN
jgi:uncharacterized protein (TIGR03437 family)